MQYLKRSSLTVGQSVYIMQRGQWVGPFAIVSLSGGRTPDHIIMRGQSGTFEHFTDDYSVAGETAPTDGPRDYLITDKD